MVRQRRYFRRRSRPRSGWRKFLDYLMAGVFLALLALTAARYERVATRSFPGAGIVVDGDTIHQGGERLRLKGIDAPELAQICRRGSADYPCGRIARDALRALSRKAGFACAGWERDKYGRLLVTCIAGDADINRAMVESGLAVDYGGYAAAEADARKAARGLWAGSFERPQDWRAAHGKEQEAVHGASVPVWAWIRQILFDAAGGSGS